MNVIMKVIRFFILIFCILDRFIQCCVHFVSNKSLANCLIGLQRDIFWKLIIPSVFSAFLFSVCIICRTFSNFLHRDAWESSETSKSLTSLGALVGNKGDTCPALCPDATLHLLLAICRLIIALGKLNSSLVSKVGMSESSTIPKIPPTKSLNPKPDPKPKTLNTNPYSKTKT